MKILSIGNRLESSAVKVVRMEQSQQNTYFENSLLLWSRKERQWKLVQMCTYVGTKLHL